MNITRSLIALFFMSCSVSHHANSNKQTTRYDRDLDIFKHEISKFKLTDGDTLVDIGSGYGTNDKIIFGFYPNMHFILEDIYKKYSKQDKYFIIVKGEKKYFKDNSIRILGSADTIPLNSGMYKNVLCRITLHEFTNPVKMLSEIKRILSGDGKLIIVEQVPKYEGEIEQACQKKLMTKTEIIDLLTSNGFKLISADSTAYEDDRFNGNANILGFTPSAP